MIPDCPIFVYHRKEPVHLIGNIFEVRRKVVPHVYRLFAVTTSKLGNVRDCRVIQGPERVLIERLDTFLKTDFNTIRQQIILSQEVLLLDCCKKRGIVFFSNRHVNGACLNGISAFHRNSLMF